MVMLKKSAECMIILGLLFEIIATLWSVALSIRADIFQFEVYDDCSDPSVFGPFIDVLQSQSPTQKYFAYSFDEKERSSILLSKYDTFTESTSPAFSLGIPDGYAEFKKRCTCNNMDVDVLVQSYYDNTIQYSLKVVNHCTSSWCSWKTSCYGQGVVGDGICDKELNDWQCNFDGGDCCNSDSDSDECIDPNANLPSSFSELTKSVDLLYLPSNVCWFLIPNGIAIVITVSIVSSLFIEVFECYFEYNRIQTNQLKTVVIFLEVCSVISVGASILSMDGFLTPGINHKYTFHSMTMLTLVLASFLFGVVGLIFQVLFAYDKGSKYLDPIGNGMIWFSSGCLEAVITLFSKWRSENSDKFSVISSEIFSFVALEILAVLCVTVGKMLWIKFQNRHVVQDDLPRKNDKFKMNSMEENFEDIEKAMVVECMTPEITPETVELECIFEDVEKEVIGNGPILVESSRKTPVIIDYPVRKGQLNK